LVTTTSTLPAACGGVVAVIDVALATETLVAAVPSKETLAPAANPDPVTVTAVPPAVVADVGAMAVIVGATAAGGGGGGGADPLYVKTPVILAVCPSGLATTRSTLPALRAGAVAVIDVALETATAVAAVVPNDTVAPATKPAPVIVTTVPPVSGPDVGATDAIDGGGTTGTSYVKPPASRPL
jgi:hypothetical protein